MTAVINAPGSWHDARIARPIYVKLLHHTPDTYYLVADTAFPRGTDSIQGKIKAAPKQNERVCGSAQERQAGHPRHKVDGHAERTPPRGRRIT